MSITHQPPSEPSPRNRAQPPDLRAEVESALAAPAAVDVDSRLQRLIDLHQQCRDQQREDLAAEVREAFLKALCDGARPSPDGRWGAFLAEEAGAEDFNKLCWQSPRRVTQFCEMLYGIQFPDDAAAERIQDCVSTVLLTALHQFEERGDYERMLTLLQTAPQTAEPSGELLRIRNRVHLYEMHRVRNRRRLLYLYLAVQALFVVVIFPLLFQHAENGKIRKAVEEATDLEIPEKGRRQYLDYSDALYWSVITAASIGYGDVTPRSHEGRVIAAVLGTMGVVTIGVVAGLILNWITPRRLA